MINKMRKTRMRYSTTSKLTELALAKIINNTSKLIDLTKTLAKMMDDNLTREIDGTCIEGWFVTFRG
jgi:hypothetical protein